MLRSEPLLTRLLPGQVSPLAIQSTGYVLSDFSWSWLGVEIVVRSLAQVLTGYIGIEKISHHGL
jgi:hypothetical protein